MIMADEATNLIMEQLHILRRGQETLQNKIEGISVDVGDLKVRISGFEATLGHVIQMGHMQSQIAIQSGRLDRIDERIGRVDNRLDRIESRLDRIERHLNLTHA
jgi:chromosome segregation ATPase